MSEPDDWPERQEPWPVGLDSEPGVLRLPDNITAGLAEAGGEAEESPAVRATMRMQDECLEPNVTFRLVDQIDMTGLRRTEDDGGFGRYVRDNGPNSCTRCGRPAGGEWVDEAGAPRCPACLIEESVQDS